MPHILNVFISYKRSNLGKSVASVVYEKLTDRGFNVFQDARKLEAGMVWAQEIYDAIIQSDVVIVLLEAETKKSIWVQRELGMARGAQIAILPLRIGDENVDDVIEELGVKDIQYLTHDIDNPDFDTLDANIRSLSTLTRKRREIFVERITDAWNWTIKKSKPKEPADRHDSFRQFELKSKKHPAIIHLTTGSIAEIDGIHVIVNSENDHLQMSRIHENHTVSSRLRYFGSWIDERTGLIMEDTVQRELDAQIDYAPDEATRHRYPLGRPIADASVYVTNAGHPSSVLKADKNIRYIFHAVTVNVVQRYSETTMRPIGIDGIKDAVANCLRMVIRVNEKKGVISPPDLVMLDGRSPRKNEEELAHSYKDLKSIIFPLLGTGHAGRSVESTIKPMLLSIRDTLEAKPEITLTDVHICVYHKEDIPLVEKAMSEVFEPVTE